MTPLKTSAWALLAFVIVAIAGLSLLPSKTAHAQIDISGDWNLEFNSAVGVTACTAAISQTGSTFDIDVECLGIGNGSLAGDIEPETGVFTASGAITGIALDIEGVASAAGDVIEGTWNSDLLGLGGTLVGTFKGPPETPAPLPTFAAPVDLSGTWDIDFVSIVSGTCVAVFDQRGTELASVVQCDIIGEVSLAGTIDPMTGAFSLVGGPLFLEAVAAADGNSFSGTFEAFGLVSGGIAGQRSDDIELIDLSGGWTFVFDGDLAAVCSGELAPGYLYLSASLDCGDLGVGEWSGRANPLAGWFELVGPLGESEVTLHGSVDGPGVSGFWSGVTRMESGWMIGAPSDQAQRGIVVVDCYGGLELQSRRCGYEVGSDAPIQIVTMLPPAAGFVGFQVALHKNGELLYTPAADPATEALWHGCLEPERDVTTTESGESVRFSCHPEVMLAPDTAAGPLLELSMACLVPGDTALVLQPGDEAAGAGTLFSIGDGSRITPLLFNATVNCYRLDGATGDVNCDGTVNSIDAALVLQHAAGLLDALPCEYLADTDGDGETTSVDATLILQHDAGLVIL